MGDHCAHPPAWFTPGCRGAELTSRAVSRRERHTPSVLTVKYNYLLRHEYFKIRGSLDRNPHEKKFGENTIILFYLFEGNSYPPKSVFSFGVDLLCSSLLFFSLDVLIFHAACISVRILRIRSCRSSVKLSVQN